MSLTPKQQRFVEEYTLDLNATQAAIRAGYSPNSVNQAASHLMANVNVKAAIDAAIAARSARTEIDAEWVLRRLVAEADADLADLFDKETGGLKPVHEWPEIWRQGLVKGVELEAVDRGDGMTAHVKRVRLSDRVRRLELIGKHVRVNAFQEQVNVKGLDTLADRLERAQRRWDASERDEELKRAVPRSSNGAVAVCLAGKEGEVAG